MINELGGEFWELETAQEKKPIEQKPHKLLLTGRTSLDYILRDIKLLNNTVVAYLPSYCCHTMIKPFIDNGVEVDFYNIYFENGRFIYDLDFNTKCNIVLIMQYFGFYHEAVGQTIRVLRDNEKIVIEDATHSWFSESPYSYNSNYIYASFRKWTGLPCGSIAIKQNGQYLFHPPTETNHEYIRLRQVAALTKKLYIEKGFGNKEKYLGLFKQAEELLEHDYSGYCLPEKYSDMLYKMDTRRIIRQRKENAKALIEGLKNISGLETIATSKQDVPLFVPIMVLHGQRERLRQYLIKNEIYCPVHWPLSQAHKISNKYLYENSLSLVCDQRYSLSDMNRILSVITHFFRKEA